MLKCQQDFITLPSTTTMVRIKLSERDVLNEHMIILILANPQMAQQLLALQQYQAAEQYNSGTGLPSYPTVSHAYKDFNLNANACSNISF